MLKRFLVFNGSNFYPGRGMDNFTEDCDDLGQAVKIALEANTRQDLYYGEDSPFGGTWFQVYDTHTKSVVVTEKNYQQAIQA